MNRTMRRQMMRSQNKKDQQLIQSYTRDQKVAEIIKNGITPQDLEEEYFRGQNDGFKSAGLNITKSCYAAICLALVEEFDFDDEQCFKALCAVDKKVAYCISHAEMADEVLEKTGLKLYLDEPIERIQLKGNNHA